MLNIIVPDLIWRSTRKYSKHGKQILVRCLKDDKNVNKQRIM